MPSHFLRFCAFLWPHLQFGVRTAIVSAIRWLVNPSITVVVGVRTMTT